MNKSYLLIFSIFVGALFGNNITELPKNLPIFKDHEYTYLISFPQSGNTLCRFLIEYLFNISTRESKTQRAPGTAIRNGIGLHCGFDIDYSSPPIIKKHSFTPHCWFNHSEVHDLDKGNVIFILRNPSRHQRRINKYFKLLNQFHFHKGRKLLIYFEDLIENPLNEIKKISDFIKKPISKERLIVYLNNPQEAHKQIASLYDTLVTPILDSYKDPSKIINEYLNKNDLTEDQVHKDYCISYNNLYKKYLARYYKPD